jgi:hypothetical protein
MAGVSTTMRRGGLPSLRGTVSNTSRYRKDRLLVP